ncbi:MAG: hypothetical protein IPJ19_20140 [Planctomycetes bacterium]|nr:hypothetical protein [Planctomycetota bacterium]
MRVKILGGAIVAMFSVWGAAWEFGGARTPSVALAAPQRGDDARAHGATAVDSMPAALRSRSAAPLAAQPDENVQEDAPRAPLASDEIQKLIADLRDDDVQFNAENAIWRLSAAGPEVLAPLEDSLRSRDRQQRLLVGYLLAGRDDAPASTELAQLLAESLEPDGEVLGVTADVQARAFARLSRDGALFRKVEARLSLGLNSDDPYMRVEAAFLLANHKSGIARARVLATLIGALEDNQVEGDGRLGLRGLVRLGGEARAALEAAWPGRDAQQGALIGHLLSALSPAHPGAHRLSSRAIGSLGFPVGDPLQLDRAPDPEPITVAPKAPPPYPDAPR